ncbi:hypothetical protein HanRHA438_Chr05g0223081 [Helianthus annuus]|nr:hypothetical protein HanHA89_Chr05g0189411 [Helianthus annuus]KAJ0750170.1 hypothetical protein HanLR1_Chr05g0178811 [Helianthus annuus]KAJ0918878.1 hypothetical protein HanRHA438_Chr05g0223081 [Helianthus annuus]
MVMKRYYSKISYKVWSRMVQSHSLQNKRVSLTFKSFGYPLVKVITDGNLRLVVADAALFYGFT